MTSKLKKRYESETTSTLKQRFQNEEMHSALRSRYVNEERVDELFGIGEKVDPERVKASLAEIGKIENMLAQVDQSKLGTLRQALVKAKADVNSQKGLDALTSFLGAVETLSRHMQEIMDAAKIGDDQLNNPLALALDPGLKTTISKMVEQHLNPGWLTRMIGRSFLDGTQIKKIGEDFLQLTKAEITKMVPIAKQIVQTGEAEKAAKEKQEQPNGAQTQNQQAGTQTGQQPQAGAQPTKVEQNVNASAPAAYKVLQDAGLAMLNRNEANNLVNMILANQAG